MPDLVMTPVDHTVIPKNSRKKDKQKARVTADKQTTNQSTKANPDVKTSAKNSHKGKKSSELEATQILTGYETVGEEQEQIRDIIVYDIPYTWDLQKIIAELKLWFNKYWMTDLGGIPVRWFPKAQSKPKAKNTPNTKKSGKSDMNLDRNQPKKKDKPASSKKVSKNNNQEEKYPNTQKAKKSSKKKGNNKDNKAVLAEILTLL
ncbi:hypothetical protein RhiirA1_478753 [Rhizophagus irregularis]|uniref:Uncharacterized protein n=1 Tax=Rhizophagus irregularis TaxID=588596 RepID=A0A2N0QRN1_9GLOM|nr:hypothetical protein RhiirA1_478753 [Rhizophagus irregularis]